MWRYMSVILDWKNYCEKVYKTKKFDRDDPSDNKSLFSQEAHYMKHLLLLGLTPRQINDEWLKLKNGMAHVFRDDPEMQQITFLKVYKSAEQIPDSIMEREYVPIRIYESESSFINNLDAPLWVKQYWYAMLIYWKFAAQYGKKVEINATLCNWALRQTDLVSTYYGHHQTQIGRYNQYEEGKFVLSSSVDSRRKSRYYWFSWLKNTTEDNFCEIKNLDKTKNAINNIISSKCVCPVCKRKFKPSIKQKTPLCPSCYLKKRRQDESARVNSYQKKKRLYKSL